ncbi:DUF4062 domain-containing protein [Tumebacillus permanentifrigoris]|uniref:Uncharacterized protein DUF4062 n=1 Tax=Tumebacillus permanentifrigoris TaxID=378543 RepID=A0A316D219_9BACL|nr:DUF4062 domain-containing protein [Tumebacillus permanentifrigoris]PWK03925.1 uncharacterized protein DUF4062 [Tumebacillus permanentifrigoris]
MPRPRVFVSSTFYDLQQVRQDVGHFVDEHGYEAVLFEEGHIAYGAADAPASYCYEEIESCDILISIIGGRFGSSSSERRYSVSQAELRRAHELGKQIHIFVLQSVHTEYETYKVNRDNFSIVLRHADDRRVYEFLDELHRLDRNNAIFPFETAQDITLCLRQQWAGLFYRFLRGAPKQPSPHPRTEEPHPAWTYLRGILELPWTAAFYTWADLAQLLNSCGYHEDPVVSADQREWSRYRDGVQYLIRASTTLFTGPNETLIPRERWVDTLFTMDQTVIEMQKKT